MLIDKWPNLSISAHESGVVWSVLYFIFDDQRYQPTAESEFRHGRHAQTRWCKVIPRELSFGLRRAHAARLIAFVTVLKIKIKVFVWSVVRQKNGKGIKLMISGTLSREAGGICYSCYRTGTCIVHRFRWAFGTDNTLLAAIGLSRAHTVSIHGKLLLWAKDVLASTRVRLYSRTTILDFSGRSPPSSQQGCSLNLAVYYYPLRAPKRMITI